MFNISLEISFRQTELTSELRSDLKNLLGFTLNYFYKVVLHTLYGKSKKGNKNTHYIVLSISIF